jgi:hypothetical protein
MRRPACTVCPIGTYGPFQGSGSCTNCTANSVTQAAGSTDVSQCLCSPGFGYSLAGSVMSCTSTRCYRRPRVGRLGSH